MPSNADKQLPALGGRLVIQVRFQSVNTQF